MLGPVLQLESGPLLDHLQVGQLRVAWALSAVIGSAGNWACPEVSTGKGQPVHGNGNNSRSAICLRLTANLPWRRMSFLHVVAIVSLRVVWPMRHKRLEHLSWAPQSSTLLPHPLSHLLVINRTSQVVPVVNFTCQCRSGFHPWISTIPWRRKWLPTPVSILAWRIP